MRRGDKMASFANWMIIFCVCSITFDTYGWDIKTKETREFLSGLNRNGDLVETTKSPNCGSEKRIYLVSYSYHQMQCRFVDDCISTHEEPLLPAELIILHQMCSMQHECRNLTFPLRSEVQRNRTNAVLIKYQCIDRSAQANICGSSIYFNDSIYLTSIDIKGPFKECQCFVNNGRFSVDLTDIRLNGKTEKECSPAKLYINDRQVSCDEIRDDYGSLFHETFGEPISNAYISLIQNSETVLPDMVLVTLTPEGSAKITCDGKQPIPKIILNSTTAKPRTTNILTRPSETNFADRTVTEEKKYNIDLTNRTLNQQSLTINIFILVIMVIMVIIMVLLLKRTTRCSLSKFKLRHIVRRIRVYLGEKYATLVPSSEETALQFEYSIHRSNGDNRLQRSPSSDQETGVDSMEVVNEVKKRTKRGNSPEAQKPGLTVQYHPLRVENLLDDERYSVDDSEFEKKTDDERPVPPPYIPLDEDRRVHPSYTQTTETDIDAGSHVSSDAMLP